MTLFTFKEDKDFNILVAKMNIENEETYHLKNLYKLIHDWLDEEGFLDIYDSRDNPEVLYLERILGTGSKEHRIWWRCLKYPSGSKKANMYYRYYIKIDFMTINMKSIEVMHQGHKMKTDRGDIIIDINAFLQLDYNEQWRNSKFMMRWDKMFRNRIYKAQVEAYKVDLYKISYRLQNIIKQYLKLKTIYEMPKPFHPEKGL